MDWCSRSNPRKKFKQDKSQNSFAAVLRQSIIPLLSIFIEYYWDERLGAREGDEELHYLKLRGVLNRHANNANWLFVRQVLNVRNRPRIQLTDEIKSNERLLHQARMTNKITTSSQLLYKLGAISACIFNFKGDINHKDKFGRTVLHVFMEEYCSMAEGALTEEQSSKGKALVEKLITRGASIYILDKAGKSVLWKAARCKDQTILKTMLACSLTHLNEDQVDAVVQSILQVTQTNRILPSVAQTMNDRQSREMIVSCLDFGEKNNAVKAVYDVLKDFDYEYEDTYIDIVRLLVCKGVAINHKCLRMSDTRSGLTLLHAAALELHLGVLQLFADNHAHFTERTDQAQTALHLACKSLSLLSKNLDKIVQTIDFLMSKGCQLDDVDVNGFTPMHCFAYVATRRATYSQDQLQNLQFVLQKLIERGASIHTLDQDKISPLRMVAKAKNQQVLEMFVCCLKDVNECDEQGNTPLHIVIECGIDSKKSEHRAGHTSIARTLVSRGADFNLANKSGMTCVDLAAVTLHTELLHFLKDAGANCKLHFGAKQSAIHAVCRSLVQFRDACKVRETIDFFISQGCDPETYDDNGYMPLHYAAQLRNVDCLDKLIELQVSVNSQTRDGLLLTPLHLAARHGQLQMMKKLVDAGAYVNAEAADGMSPIFMSVLTGSCESTRYLFEQGANLQLRDKILGFNLLHLAILACDNLFSTLIKLQINRQPDANDEARKTLIFLLENADYQLNDLDSCEITPLQFASLTGQVGAVKVLIERGADVNFRKEQWQLTALHYAAINRHTAVVEMLIKAGARVDCRAGNGQWTPLHLLLADKMNCTLEILKESYSEESSIAYAMSVYLINRAPCSSEILKIFIQSAADLNARDASGNSPLHYAALLPTSFQTKALLDAGARPNVQNNQAQTPLSNACLNEKLNSFGVLLEYGADINDDDVSQIIAKNRKLSNGVAIEHAIKLKLLGLPTAKVYDTFIQQPKFVETHDVLSAEVEMLKDHLIDDFSLYDFLRMNPKRQYLLLDKVSNSFQEIDKLFPHYCNLIRAAWRQAINRKPLLESARMAWQQVTNIHFPDVCLEAILAHSSNRCLDTLVEATRPIEAILPDDNNFIELSTDARSE